MLHYSDAVPRLKRGWMALVKQRSHSHRLRCPPDDGGSQRAFPGQDGQTGLAWNAYPGEAVLGPVEGDTLRQMPVNYACWFT